MSRRGQLKNESRVTETAAEPAVVGAVRPPGVVERRHPASPHLLDLKTVAVRERPIDYAKRRKARRPPWKLKQMLDERLHLHDLRMRTLSIRPRGWKDFPPPKAKTVGHAVGITLVKFFREHPLAELTVLTVVHLFVVALWKISTFPVRCLFNVSWARPKTGTDDIEQLLPIIPLAAVAIKKEAGKPRTIPDEPFLSFGRPPGWRRSVLGFAALAVLGILAVGVYGSFGALRQEKQAIMQSGMQGIDALKAAGKAAEARDFAKAGSAFDQAFQYFSDARTKLGPIGLLIAEAAAALPTGSVLSSAEPLLTAGREIAEGGAALSRGLTALGQAKDPAAKVTVLAEYIDNSLPHLEEAARSLSQVAPEAVPEKYRATLVAAKDQMPRVTDGIRRAASVAGLLRNVMGTNGAKRYLVIFQNNAELRPTGGFIGSFALVDIDRGLVKKVEIPGGGSYDLKGGLRARLVSPRPLHLINANWEFQDANWFADFPTSAKKIAWFYEKSGGPTTDGVIALTAGFMEDILDVTGPIDMPEYGKKIDAQNFYFETQKAVELDYDKTENQPKQFIADLAPKVLARILAADQNTSLQLVGSLDKALAGKDLLFWFRDPAIQARSTALGWSGEIKGTDGDYLDLIHTNIAGQKTDLVMKDAVDYSVQVLPDGTGIATMTLKRTHGGAKNALFSGVRNVDFLRVYTPYGSTLVEASGFTAPDPKLFKIADSFRGSDPDLAEMEADTRIDRASSTRISTESGKTVFGNWIQTDPGQTSVVTLVYKLPPGTVRFKKLQSNGLTALYDWFARRGERRGLSYSLLVQKQPGANPAAFTSRVDFPRGYRVVWQSPERTADDRGRLSVTQDLERDMLLGAVAQIN